MTDARLSDLKDFYALLDALSQTVGGARILGACSGRLTWPRRGVYFFMEEGEHRSSSGVGRRIVRVGTHALKTGSATKLWTRLCQHRGQAKTGGGNHRGSIFRLLLGTALMAREGLSSPTWGDGNIAIAEMREREFALERIVTEVIGSMPFLWLAVDDDPGAESRRGYIERNAIALLSNFGRAPLDPPTATWLGYWCNRERVRRSGLWNQNHVEERYDPGFLLSLERLVSSRVAAP